MTQKPTASIQVQKPRDRVDQFRVDLARMKDQIAAALPRAGLTPDRFARLVMTSVRKNPGILSCTTHSVFAALMEAASLGLEPDGTLGLAYLVPYGNACQLIIGYRGLIELARRSGMVSSVRAHIVRTGDYFVYQLGLEPKLEHIPQDVLELHNTEVRQKALEALGGASEGMLLAAYSVIDMKDSTKHFEVVTRSFIDRIRKASRGSANAASPWNTWEDQMWRKTAIRQGLKYVPLSTDDRVAAAISGKLDERIFKGLSDAGEIITIEDGNGSEPVGGSEAGPEAPTALDQFAQGQAAAPPAPARKGRAGRKPSAASEPAPSVDAAPPPPEAPAPPAHPGQKNMFGEDAELAKT